MQKKLGTLYIVATPIGNLEDMSLRALNILKQVDLIAAEDTRTSQKLLIHFGIQTKLIALHAHNEMAQAEKLIEKLQAGNNIALISDAGTPLISDPGSILVNLAHQNQLQVSPIPGANAAIAAMSAAGIKDSAFYYMGFLSSKSGERERQLKKIIQQQQAFVFYESCHRIEETLIQLQTLLPDDFQIILAKELTKNFEKIMLASVGGILAWLKQDPKHLNGEFVVIVPSVAQDVPAEQITLSIDTLLLALLQVMSLKQAAELGAKITNLGKNQVYERCLQLKNL